MCIKVTILYIILQAQERLMATHRMVHLHQIKVHRHSVLGSHTADRHRLVDKLLLKSPPFYSSWK